MRFLRCFRIFLLVFLVFLVHAGGPTSGQADPDPEPLASDATTEPEEEPPAGPDLGAANELVRAGNFSEAETLLAAIQGEFPDDPQLTLMRGEVLLALGRFDDALPVLRRSAEIDGDRPRVNFQLATALQVTGDRQGALDAFARELEFNQDTSVQVMVRLNRSVLLEQARDWAASAEELEQVLALEPGRTEVYGDVAALYLQAGELELAARSLDRGAGVGFRSAGHFYSLGARYYDKKSYEQAVQAFRQALEIDPAMASAERSLAGALDQLGDAEAALQHLRRYRELKPDAPDADKVNERIRALEGS